MLNWPLQIGWGGGGGGGEEAIFGQPHTPQKNPHKKPTEKHPTKNKKTTTNKPNKQKQKTQQHTIQANFSIVKIISEIPVGPTFCYKKNVIEIPAKVVS